jgi:hypothetical protein
MLHNKIKLQIFNDICMQSSYITFFCANFYNGITNENLKKYNEEEGSFLSYIMINSICYSFGCGFKSACLALVYPLVWFDIGYSYCNNRFYKKHLIYNYKTSGEYIEYCDKKKTR